jgi:hypothetical protein
MTKKEKIKKPKRSGLPKGHKKSIEHAEKLREIGKLGGRPRREVIFKGRILKPGEKVDLPEPDIIIEELLYFLRIQGTEEEIAGHYLMSVDTLNRRIKEHLGLGFADLKKLVQAGGKLGLKITQHNQAKKSPIMSKHLGEIWLGQKSTNKLEVTNVGQPVFLPIKKKLNE